MKKYSSGSFIDAAVRVYGSEADTITSFPATIYADGESASALIKGNLQQSGTPTPQNPVDVVGVGELETSGEHAGQYKIPILNGSVTTNVYLGEVETERKIKKLVLDGTETFSTIASGNKKYFRTYKPKDSGYPSMSGVYEAVCTHFPYASITSDTTNVGCMASVPPDGSAIHFRPDNVSDMSSNDFKTYLAQQYANGTPVTVWYVLATPTTGIVNEPLMKIGDYADSVSATVPTLATAESITVDTTLKPSAVQLTYTGWHTHDDKKRSGGAWT